MKWMIRIISILIVLISMGSLGGDFANNQETTASRMYALEESALDLLGFLEYSQGEIRISPTVENEAIAYFKKNGLDGSSNRFVYIYNINNSKITWYAASVFGGSIIDPAPLFDLKNMILEYNLLSYRASVFKSIESTSDAFSENKYDLILQYFRYKSDEEFVVVLGEKSESNEWKPDALYLNLILFFSIVFLGSFANWQDVKKSLSRVSFQNFAWRNTSLIWIVSLILLVVASLVALYFFSDHIPFYLIIALSILLLLLAIWQAPRIRAQLQGFAPEASAKRSRAWRYWGIRLGSFFVLLVALVLAEAAYWTKQNDLPLDYALKKPLWTLGINAFVPLPELVRIPQGQFEMGSDDGDDDEKPVHTVSIERAFSMGKYEVTFEQYDYFVMAMRRASISRESDREEGKTEPYPFPSDQGWGRGQRPVINVSWHDAQDYANWLGHQTQQVCRLPNEAEWEYAARAGTTTAYPWGDAIGKNKANCDGCGSQWDNQQTAPVGQFPANKFGLYDMHGNVWEWTQDCWHDNYQEAPGDGIAWESQCSEDDSRVLRGGSWTLTPFNLRSALHNWGSTDYRILDVGFRVVCSPPSDR